MVNYLLASCRCKAASEPIRNESGDMQIHLFPDTVAELYQYIEDGSITVHPRNTYCGGVSLPLHQGIIVDQSLVLTQILIFHAS